MVVGHFLFQGGQCNLIFACIWAEAEDARYHVAIGGKTCKKVPGSDMAEDANAGLSREHLLFRTMQENSR